MQLLRKCLYKRCSESARRALRADGDPNTIIAKWRRLAKSVKCDGSIFPFDRQVDDSCLGCRTLSVVRYRSKRRPLRPAFRRGIEEMDLIPHVAARRRNDAISDRKILSIGHLT
jgi:hypothetical protein